MGSVGRRPGQSSTGATRTRLGRGRTVSRILVVADDVNGLTVCTRELEREGHLVLAAGDVHEALSILRETRPDVFVLLARANGGIPFRSTEWVLVHFADVPVIVCTPGGHCSSQFSTWPAEAVVRMTDGLAGLKTAVARALVRGKTRRFKLAVGPPVGTHGAQAAPAGA